MKKSIFYPAGTLLKGIPKVDFHIHTDYTDGQNSIQDYAQTAINKDYQAMCFTEHVDKTTTWFNRFREEVTSCREKLNDYRLKIYYGIEVRAADFNGNLNAHDKIINSAEVVMGVIHSYPAKEGGGTYNLAELTRKEAMKIEFEATMALLDNPSLDILGHPGHTYEKHYAEFPPELYRKIIRKAKQKGVAVEINPRYQRNLKTFLQLCMDEDVLISLGSNCHKVEDFGRVQKILRRVLI